jgi:ribosomal protein S18 acetylase RimI-like enzyme
MTPVQERISIRETPIVTPKNLVYNDKIISRVFSFLDFRTLANARLVCKQWNELSSKTFSFTVAKVEHSWQIAELVVAAFAKGDKFRKIGQRRTSEADVAEDMQYPNNTWYILSYKTEIIGAVLYTEDSETTVSFHMLSIQPDYWGQKLGVCLLNRVEIIARNSGKTYMQLSAAQTNKQLIKYYEEQGFKKIEEREEVEYFSPEYQQEYLIPEFQGYEEDGRAKLRNYDMIKVLS